MKVWITRTQPGADRLAEAVQAVGWEAYVAPVFEIEALDEPWQDADTDLCVVLSGHAMHAVPQSCRRYLAVGPGTARLLEDRVGIKPFVPRVHSSEGIVEWLDEHPTTGPVLVVRGRESRGVVEAYLAELGTVCDTRIAYRRKELCPDVKVLQIDAIEVASGDGVKRAAQVWFAAGGTGDVPVLVPSARVGDLAHECGMRRVTVCEGASPEAYVAAMVEYPGMVDDR